MLPTSMMMIPDPSDIGNIPQQTIPAKVSINTLCIHF